jgi:hypothetical protein
LERILHAGNEFKENYTERSLATYQRLATEIETLDGDGLLFAAFAAAGVACTFEVFQDPLRLLVDDERMAFEQFQLELMLFWSETEQDLYKALSPEETPDLSLKDILRAVSTNDMKTQQGRQTLQPDRTGLLLRVSLVTEAIDMLLGIE